MATTKEQWRTMTNEEYYKKLSGRLGYPDSKRLPVIFSHLVEPIEAEMILHMPATEEDLVQKMGLDRATVDKHIKRLYEAGICNPGRVGWRMLPTYWQIKDAASPSWKMDDRMEVIWGKGSIWEQFEKKEWFPRNRAEYLARLEMSESDQPTGRIFANWHTIEGIPGVEWYDDIREVLKIADKTEDGITVGRCACRMIHGDQDVPNWVCFNFGRFAAYNTKRGAFKRVSVEESLEVLERAYEAGLVQRHTPFAQVVERQICNCGEDGCPTYGMQNLYSILQSQRNTAPSRFVPVVDLDKCNNCGICIEQCRQHAMAYKFYEDKNIWRAYVDLERCMGAGTCAFKCPENAIKMAWRENNVPIPYQMPILTAAQRSVRGAVA